MNAKTNPRLELNPKITHEEIQDATHKNELHIGKSVHFQDLLRMLIAAKAFGYNTTASSITLLMYEQSGQITNTYTELKKNDNGEIEESEQDKTSLWGERRFEKLRYGRLSFYIREAEYFHMAFRRLFGDEYANQISAQNLILNPLKQTLEQIQHNSIHSPWDILDPISALRILQTPKASKEQAPSITIHTINDLRFSDQGDEEINSLQPAEEKLQLPPGTEFYLNIEHPNPQQLDCLIIEYAEQPLTNPDSDKQIQAQLLTHKTTKTEDTAKITLTGANNRMFKILDQPGDYGFCAITYPKEWDLQEAFNIDPSKEAKGITTTELQQLAKNIRIKSIKSSDIKIALLDYRVS